MKLNFDKKLPEDLNYYITSDLHFYHEKIMTFCPNTRPWKDKNEMNEALIRHWNDLVGPDDVIFHLGDFSFSGMEATKKVLDRLNGHKIFIRGNHCKKVTPKLDVEWYDYLEVNFEGTKVCMMHYPIASWNCAGRGSVMLHGHTHGTYKAKGRIMDVGFDAQGEIIRLKDAVNICLKQEIYTPDHH